MKERLRWMSLADAGVGGIPPNPPFPKGGARLAAEPERFVQCGVLPFPPFLKGGRGDLTTADLPNRVSHGDDHGPNPASTLGQL
jgi:hypothetical protein